MADPFRSAYHAAVVTAERSLLKGAYRAAWDDAWQANYQAAVAASGRLVPPLPNPDDWSDINGARVVAYLAAGRETERPDHPFVVEVLYLLADAIPASTDDLVSEAAREIAEALAAWMGAVSALVSAAGTMDEARPGGLRRFFGGQRSEAAQQATLDQFSVRVEATLKRLDDVAHKHAERATAVDALFLLVDTLELEAEGRLSRGDSEGAARIVEMGKALLDHIKTTVDFLDIVQQRLLSQDEA